MFHGLHSFLPAPWACLYHQHAGFGLHDGIRLAVVMALGPPHGIDTRSIGAVGELVEHTSHLGPVATAAEFAQIIRAGLNAPSPRPAFVVTIPRLPSPPGQCGRLDVHRAG